MYKISHIINHAGRWEIQTNEKHLTNVARSMEFYANKFGLKSLGYVIGLLHDKGKERNSFQDYIKKESGFDTSIHYVTEHKHAFVGGIIARKWYGKALADSLLVNPIISHHSGLYDYDKISNIVEADRMPTEIEVEDEPIIEMDILVSEIKTSLQMSGKSHFHHLPRMLFSCLVDADRLDTEAFMDKSSSALRKQHTNISQLATRLENYLNHLQQTAPDTPINHIRAKVQSRCKEMSCYNKGFYSLTVPTGGGKTLSSIVWAMRHAIHYGLDRIIIAIPYTSIIAQTAAVLRCIFGEENVLEHHSNVNYDRITKPELKRKLEMAAENWDYPIIVTTNVQLFESMYSNSPSACRKLHNICRSVLILDEVQTLPTDFLQPIVSALKAYQQLFGVSVLFTTASQPILSGLISGCNIKAQFDGIEHITEIIPRDMNLHEALRRVSLQIDYTPLSYDELAKKLSTHDRVLCIVNTRQDAKEIYERLPKEGITLHLSRMMCSKHIAQTIDNIRDALSNSNNNIIRIVATQLIEAGVDIDFPVVYRQESGLDSVLQAAGRCNREGKLPIATTYVFSLSKEHPMAFGTISKANNAMKEIYESRDWFAPETMTTYFTHLYSKMDSFDKKEICELLDHSGIQYESAAHEFKLINDNSISIIVNWGDSASLIDRIRQGDLSYEIMKKLSMYSIGVYERDFKKLCSYGVIEEVIEGIYFIRDKTQYSNEIGLRTDNHWYEEVLVI